MKRPMWEGQTVVYRYGCPSWADLPAEAIGQLRLAHQLRNQLVAAQRNYDQMRAAVKDDSELLAEADAAKKCAVGRCLSSDRCAGGEGCKPSCHHRCPDPSLPRIYTQWTAQGLGWATVTDILDKHHVSVRRVIEARKAGQPAECRFRAWRGEGTLTVQVQRDSQWAIEDGRPAKEWLDRDRRVHESLGARHRTLRLQIGRQGGLFWLDLPLVYHRRLPEGAQVTYVRVTRRIVGGSPRISVQFTVRLPDPPLVPAGSEVVDVDLRWTSGEGGVRVARIATTSGNLPPPPADITHLVRIDDTVYELWAGARWRDLLARDDDIRSRRSMLLDQLRPVVVQALADPALAELVGYTPAQARLMHFGKYDRLARRWPVEHPAAEAVRAWRQRDRHLWAYEAHERDQVVAARRDAYRKAAAWIADAAHTIAVKDTPVAKLRRKPPSDQDTHQAQGARRNVQFAAPAEFRAAVEHAAARRGVPVIHYTEGTSTT